ncbi:MULTISPECIES: transcriptional regulator [Nitrosopumilus]|uniref:Transcriptional regulator protein-like protein n=1 Tax=Nitrosopumilus piranensis TaxID=1582439 RepID=A0A0C5BVL2_9ARCH|nr:MULTISPECIES: transcriptional regulator [Nitrosopumilus]AJM92296.1 Transcriptional regulator protein-like protein [Nitrosopumilus piranensis]KAF6244238.1 transcriptional regulator [Nitrosopumilus sp. b2]
MDKYEVVSANFLELASEQRLKILSHLSTHPLRVSVLAKKINVTSQEIHRNLERLSNSGFVKKGVDEHFHITTIGQLMLSQMPLMFFITKNQKYFASHDVGVLPIKFSRRLGVLENCEHIKGVTNVLNKWKSIYKNSKEFVYDITNEMPLGMDEILLKRIKNGVKYRHIVSKDLDEPEDRTSNLQKLGYYDFIQKGKIERKELSKTKTVLILNENEAGIVFPTSDGEPDLRHMFYGDGTMFLDWCIDYFDFYWKKSKKISKFPKR